MISSKKITEYGLYLFIFLIPWQTRWIAMAGEINGGYSEYTTISLYMTDIAFFCLFLLSVVNILCNSQTTASNKRIWYYIAGLELMIFVSCFFALDKVLAFYAYGRFLLGVGLFWVITQTNFDKFRIMWGYVVGVFIHSVIGVWQFFAQSDFSNKWLGIAYHASSNLGTSVIESGGGRWLRAYGGFDHPNILGAAAAFALIFLIIIKLETKKINILNLIIFYIVYFIIFLALLFSFSRAAWLAFFVACVFMLLKNISRKKLTAQKGLLEIVLVSGFLFFIISSLYLDLFTTRFSSSGRLERISSSERIYSSQRAGELIKNNFWFGNGIGNYSLVDSLGDFKKRQAYNYQPVHNIFLLVWAEIGFLGLVFFLLVFYELIQNLNKTNWENLDIVIMLFMFFLLDHWFWSLHFGVLCFWFLLGLAEKEYLSELRKKI